MKTNDASVRMWRSGLLFFAVLSGVACRAGSREVDSGATATLPVVGADAGRKSLEVVFQAVRVLNRDGREVESRQQGQLTLDVWQRAARPWSYLREPYIYHEQTWESALGDGNLELGYRVVRTHNTANITPRAVEVAAVDIRPEVVEWAKVHATVDVIVTLRDYPDWDVPLIPSSPFLSQEDIDLGMAQRQAALEAREKAFEVRAASLVAHLRDIGGRIEGTGSGSGWIIAALPSRALDALALREDIARVDLIAGGASDQSDAAEDAAGAEDATTASGGRWALGEAGQASRMDADRFRAFGFDGESANPSRHGFGDVVVGVSEIGILHDEVCFLSDGASCNQGRLRGKYLCDGAVAGDRCYAVSNLPATGPSSLMCCAHDPNMCAAQNPAWACVAMPAAIATGCASNKACYFPSTGGFHATGVTSVVAGDYRGLADPFPVGNLSAPSQYTHSATWKNRATGIAPEASVVFWGGGPAAAAAGEDRFAGQFRSAVGRHVDILNNSWVWAEAVADCNPVAVKAFEKEAENAFDDGILVVAAAGNNSANAGCTILSPADLPKVLGVNGLNTFVRDPAGVDGPCDYKSNCLVASTTGARGGAPATTPDLQRHDGALSGIGFAAPTTLAYFTVNLGPAGFVYDVGGFSGSSGAAAVTSGAAALVKSAYLAQGQTWINAPGRLQTVLLAMTDRHVDAGPTQLLTGANNLYGLGRLKLRRFSFSGSDSAGAGTRSAEGDAAGRAFTDTLTLTSSEAVSRTLFASAQPAGTRLVKCVMLQVEDMQHKSTISNVDLTVEVRASVDGACDGNGSLITSRSDTSYDVKSMVAITATDATLAGSCLNAVVNPLQIAAVNGVAAVTTHLMCYASSVPDDGELPDADGDGLADADELATGSDPNLRDTDGDGLDDGVEVNERFTSALLADTDGDGLSDAGDVVTFDYCTTRGLAPPELVAQPPRLGTARPTLAWSNANDSDGARIDVCADSACQSIRQTLDVRGTSAALVAELPSGASFWRAFARSGEDLGCRPSETGAFCVSDAAVQCPPAQTLECTGSLTNVALVASCSDVCGPCTAACSPTQLAFGGGSATAVTCSAEQAASATCQTAVTVVDTTPPAIALAPSPAVLWPPNHGLVPIALAVNLADACDPSPHYTCSASANESDTAAAGNHDVPDDIQWIEGQLWLRAERNGTGPGRAYTVTCIGTDATGNAAVASASVYVPHDQDCHEHALAPGLICCDE